MKYLAKHLAVFLRYPKTTMESEWSEVLSNVMPKSLTTERACRQARSAAHSSSLGIVVAVLGASLLRTEMKDIRTSPSGVTEQRYATLPMVNSEASANT